MILAVMASAIVLLALVAVGVLLRRRAWPARGLWLAGIIGLPVLGVAAGLYWRLADRLPPRGPFIAAPSQDVATGAGGHRDLQDAATRLAEALKTNPSNVDNWLLYARTISMLGDWQLAGDAYRHAIELGEKAADVFASYGEMLVLAANGIVSPAAHDAFATALAGDPKNEVARYYLALADSQAGKPKQAIDEFLALAADIPADSSMRDEIVLRIAEAAKAGGLAMPLLPVGATPPVGADAGDLAAVAQMPKSERQDTIRELAALATHTQGEPNDVDGWLRLANAYARLGETDKSADAYEHAARLKPDDIDIKLEMVDVLLEKLQPRDPLPSRAVVLLRQVQAIAPDEPKALWYLGIVASREGHQDEARRDWTRLLSVLPANSEDYKLVKRALAELGEK